MRIDRLHIDRFGIIADQAVPALSPGLTCFLGNNEAGKSTCLRFFQSMLFGYRRGKSSLDPMNAKAGKSLAGGSLFLNSPLSGDLILTRRPGPHGGPVSLADASGSPLAGADNAGEVLLPRLFGGMTMDVFDAIFAFSLKELMEFSSFSGEKVRHALHGAAFGQGLRSPAQVLKQLDDRLAALLKAERGSAAINNAWRELKEVQEALKEREPEVALYAALNSELEALEEELALLRRRREGHETLLRRARRRGDLWQQWEGLGRARAELVSLGVYRDDASAGHTGSGRDNPGNPETAEPIFAPDAVQRLDALLAQREERLLSANGQERALARLDDELARLDAEAAALSVDELQTTAVQTLREQKEQRRAEAESLPPLLAERTALERAQRECLASLGPGWSAERIAGLDLSLAAGQTLLDNGEEIRRLTAHLERLAHDRDRLAEEADEAAGQEEEAASRMPPDLSPEGDLPDKASAANLGSAIAGASSRLAELPALLERREKTAAEAGLALSDIDPALTPETLRSIDFSQPVRRRLAEAAAGLAAATRERDEAALRQRLTEEREEEALRRTGRTRELMAAHAALPDAETIADRQRLLRRLRSSLSDHAAANRAAREARQALDARGPSGNAPLPRAKNPLFIAGMQLALAGLALAAGGLAGSFPSLLYAGAAMTLLGLPLCLLRKLASRDDGDNDAVRAALADAETRLSGFEADLRRLGDEAAPWLDAAFPPDEESLDLAALALDVQSRALGLAERDARDGAEAEVALENAEREAERAREDHAGAQTARDRAATIHDAGIAGLGLARTVPPEDIKALLEAVASALVRDEAALEAGRRFDDAAATVTACFDAAARHSFFANALKGRDNSAAQSFLPETTVTVLETPAARAAAAEWLAALSRAMTALDALREQEQERRSAAFVLQERHIARERAGRRLAKAQGAVAETEAALAEVQDVWRKALAVFGLPGGTNPASAADALALLREFTSRDKKISAVTSRMRGLGEALAGFITEVTALAESMRVPLPALLAAPDDSDASDGSVPARRIPAALALLDALGVKADDAGRAASLLAAKREQRVQFAQGLEGAREALAMTESTLTELLGSVHAPDAESFRSAFARYSRIEALRRDERALLEALRNLAAEEAVTLEGLLASFAANSPERLAEEAAEQEERLSVLDADMAERAQRQGGLLERRSGLAADGGGSELRRREAALREHLHRLSRQWSVPALARELLLAAKERFEREGRQGVLRHAGAIFRAVTHGEYEGIAMALDGESFTALHRSGDLRDPEKQLSQGTREQLYLALRLAFIRNHAEKAEPMPVFMDDILVNFDPERAAATAAVLAEFAGANQVLFFTCHPMTAELLMRAAPDKKAAGENATGADESNAAKAVVPASLLYCIDKGRISVRQ